MSNNNPDIPDTPDTRETRLSGPTGSAFFGLWTRAAPGEGPSAAPTYAPYGQPYPATFDQPHSQLQDHPPDHLAVRAHADRNQVAQNLPIQQHQARPVTDSHALEYSTQPFSDIVRGQIVRFQQIQVLTPDDLQRPGWPSLTGQDHPRHSYSGTGEMRSTAGQQEFPQSQHYAAHEYQAQRYRAQQYLAQRYQAQQHQPQQHAAASAAPEPPSPKSATPTQAVGPHGDMRLTEHGSVNGGSGEDDRGADVSSDGE
ncbi:hypothetical protein BDV97DRAFT_395145 [Delphinella strobiligena]|nr:hypothetical protein BDV97DRAFT_395145 [Delphinella strobiligena]